MAGERGWRACATACAAMLLLTGCADDPDDGVPDASPLAEILGWGMASDRAGGPPEVTEADRQRQLQVEQLIADCMAEAGFEYLPIPVDQRRTGPYDEAYALGPAEFAARYGYGVTTLPSPGDQQPVNPNHAIVEDLPPGQRREYQAALWGDAATGTPHPEGERAGQGCQTWANQEVYGRDAGGMADGHDRFADLLEQLDRLWERIEGDPRLADADHDWAECMTTAGYPGFTRPHEAQQSVFDEMERLTRDGAEPDPDALGALRRDELTLAPIDHDCREQHIEAPRREVAFELEAEFVEEHRAELEAYRDWTAGLQPGGSPGS